MIPVFIVWTDCFTAFDPIFIEFTNRTNCLKWCHLCFSCVISFSEAYPTFFILFNLILETLEILSLIANAEVPKVPSLLSSITLVASIFVIFNLISSESPCLFRNVLSFEIGYDIGTDLVHLCSLVLVSLSIFKIRELWEFPRWLAEPGEHHILTFFFDGAVFGISSSAFFGGLLTSSECS